MGSELAGVHTSESLHAGEVHSHRWIIFPILGDGLDLIRFTNGCTFLGICLHNTIRTHVLNILSGLKGSFHNTALCDLQNRQVGRMKGLGMYSVTYF